MIFFKGASTITILDVLFSFKKNDEPDRSGQFIKNPIIFQDIYCMCAK